MEMRKAIFGLFILACANTQGAVLNQSATELGALAAIELESRAASRGYTNIQVEVQPLDTRVRLRLCDGEPAVIPDTANMARMRRALCVVLVAMPGILAARCRATL